MSWLGADIVDERPVGGGDIGRASCITLADGRRVFVKRYDGPRGESRVETEAHDLRWLHEVEGGPPIPEVIAIQGNALALEWIDEGPRTATADEQLGRTLATLHAAGAPAFGGTSDHLGSVAVPNIAAATWSEWWVANRLLPLTKQAADLGRIDPAPLDALARVAGDRFGPDEPVARLHGDLWWGNVVTGADGRAWLVDPAAHGGHREVDLAMLALFGGLPSALVQAYQEVVPLGAGWRDRIALHQLTPLLVHAILFGGTYGMRATEVARAYA